MLEFPVEESFAGVARPQRAVTVEGSDAWLQAQHRLQELGGGLGLGLGGVHLRR